MARIRSIHPGQWTDEDFVSCRMPARLLAIALRNEADDQGVFEWKPLTIKMRLFPADDVAVVDLLEELVTHNVVRQFEWDGRQYGVIRNFCEFQKPKSPTASFPLPRELWAFADMSDEYASRFSNLPEEVRNSWGTTSEPLEKNPRRGEERREEEKEEEGKEKKYIFAGRTVRLVKRDRDQWAKAYHAIPDLDAELTRIDAALTAKGERDWYVAAGNMLAAKHQKLLAESRASPGRRPAGGVIPLGVGG